jgi:tetratricopeptide (TPR) repeat protein
MKAEQIFKYIQMPEKLNQDTLPFLKELMQRHPAFEAGWMLYLKNLKNINDSLFEQELINGAIRIHDRRKLYLFLNQKTQATEQKEAAANELPKVGEPDVFNLIFAPEYRLETSEKIEDTTEGSVSLGQKGSEKKFLLIDKFLEAQPKMPGVKNTESSSPMERSEQSKEENDDLVTETLASIYAQQGYYKKALQIFEKLSLKYPEKSTYFAAHIEKIKNLMNN